VIAAANAAMAAMTLLLGMASTPNGFKVFYHACHALLSANRILA
jgi:hypothetical protein